ncbi:MAG: glycosyltransferase family 2 protein, partial [Verrucomicrobiota bacterium]
GGSRSWLGFDGRDWIGEGRGVERLPLSCYIRTLNEEYRIGEVVEAALEVAAEVICVDSGSTDATVAIAEEKGARVIRQEWLGNGGQKRVGEQAAQYDWVLDLDADEVVSRELGEEIRGLFVGGEPEGAVYELKLVTIPPFGQPWLTSCLAWRRKLYDRRKFQMPDHAAWDQLEIPKEVPVGRLKGPLFHYSFKDVEHMLAKMNRVSSVRGREKKLKSLGVVKLRILFGFPGYFFKKYVKQQMFREGVYGFACAVVLAGQRWLTDVKMLERHMKEAGNEQMKARDLG